MFRAMNPYPVKKLVHENCAKVKLVSWKLCGCVTPHLAAGGSCTAGDVQSEPKDEGPKGWVPVPHQELRVPAIPPVSHHFQVENTNLAAHKVVHRHSSATVPDPLEL